jgi:uncharacterized membrane protein
MGEHHTAPLPNAVYGLVLFLSGGAYNILQRQVLAPGGPDSRLAKAIGRDIKGTISVATYAAAIPLAYVNQWISDALYVFVALLWLIPDRRVERALTDEHSHHGPAVTR